MAARACFPLTPRCNGAWQARCRAEVAFDRFTRGRFATDASIYQIIPAGVALPKSAADLEAALKIAGECGVSVTMRGGDLAERPAPSATD